MVWCVLYTLIAAHMTLGCTTKTRPSSKNPTDTQTAQQLLVSAPNTHVGTHKSIKLTIDVLDAQGHPIQNPTLRTIAPRGQVLDPTHVRFAQEGRYTVRVEVLNAKGQATLSQQLMLIVNDHGPTITCDGLPWPVRPGQPIAIRGNVQDPLGVRTLRVLGEDVTIDQAGRWATTWIPPHEGLFALDISATDGEGLDSNTTCLGMAAPAYPDVMVAAHVHLTQDALDDQDRSDADSLGDLLHAALHSSALRESIHRALSRQNPLKNSCDQRVLGACVMHTRVNYKALELQGPHTIELSFVQGGIRARVHMRGARVNTTIKAGPTGASGWATLSSMTLDMTLPLTLKDNQIALATPRIHDVTLGRLSTSYSGIMGSLIEASGWALEDNIRQHMTQAITKALATHASAWWNTRAQSARVLSLDVPRLDGQPAAKIERKLAPSALRIRPGALTTSIAVSKTRSTLAPPSTPPAAPKETTHAYTARVSLAPINQLLQELWSAKHFTLPTQHIAGTTWSLRLLAPPLMRSSMSGTLMLDVGPVAVNMKSPLGETSFHVGAHVNLTLAPHSRALVFQRPELTRLFVQWPETMHALMMRQSLHALVRTALTQTIARAWGEAPKKTPWPSYILPEILRPTSTHDTVGFSEVILKPTRGALDVRATLHIF